MRKNQTEVPYPIPYKWLSRRLSLLSFFPPDILDLSDRSVLEGRSYLYKLSDGEKHNCRYRDCRLNHIKPMNLGAMKEFAKNKSDVFKFITLLSQHVAIRYPDLGKQGLCRLWALSYIGWSIPFFSNTQQCTKTDMDTVSAAEASFAKLSHGVLTLIKNISEKHDFSGSYTAQELYEIANTEKKLIGKSEVCAAPPNVIIEIIDFMLQSGDAVNDGVYVDQYIEQKILYAKVKRNIELVFYYYEISRMACYCSDGSELSVSYCFPYWKDLIGRFKVGQLDKVIAEISQLNFPDSEVLVNGLNVDLELQALKDAASDAILPINFKKESVFLAVEALAIRCLNLLEVLLHNQVSTEYCHLYTRTDVRNFTHGRVLSRLEREGSALLAK